MFLFFFFFFFFFFFVFFFFSFFFFFFLSRTGFCQNVASPVPTFGGGGGGAVVVVFGDGIFKKTSCFAAEVSQYLLFFLRGTITPTETNHKAYYGQGAQDGHLDFHTAPELCLSVPGLLN